MRHRVVAPLNVEAGANEPVSRDPPVLHRHHRIELAVRLGRSVRVTPACCSIAVGEEVMALDDNDGLVLDVKAVLKQQEAQRRLKGIPVVNGAAGGCCRSRRSFNSRVAAFAPGATSLFAAS